MIAPAPRRKQLALFSIRAAWVAREVEAALEVACREQRSREDTGGGAGRRGRAFSLEERALAALLRRGLQVTAEIAGGVRAGSEARAACWD